MRTSLRIIPGLLSTCLLVACDGGGRRPDVMATEPPPIPVARYVPSAAAPLELDAPEGMVGIPAGPFFRGCSNGFSGIIDEKCAPSEMPAGIVGTKAFFIDRNEVTVSRYTRCVKAGGCPEPLGVGECNFGVSGRDMYPINCVTWADADRFCRWEGRRLPTEAEWEKAARGTDGRRYPWGNDEPDAGGLYRANYGEGLTSILWMRDTWEYDGPVGSFSAWPSPYGCNDMAGNVAEWVHDWWAPSYAGSGTVDPVGPASGDQHVVRGGSFREYRHRIRTSARGYHYDGFFDGNVGFRCAADIKK